MSEYKYLGDFSATPPQYSRHMTCFECKVSWTGCWDNFMCPQCLQGELPSTSMASFEDYSQSNDQSN